jgi:hypothetical protein
MWDDRHHPIFGELRVLGFGGDVVVKDSLALLELAKSFLGFDHGYPVRNIRVDELDFFLTYELIHELCVPSVPASEHMISEADNGSVLN